MQDVNPLSANPRKWSNTLKQFADFANKLFGCVSPFCGVKGLQQSNKHSRNFVMQNETRIFIKNFNAFTFELCYKAKVMGV